MSNKQQRENDSSPHEPLLQRTDRIGLVVVLVSLGRLLRHPHSHYSHRTKIKSSQHLSGIINDCSKYNNKYIMVTGIINAKDYIINNIYN